MQLQSILSKSKSNVEKAGFVRMVVSLLVIAVYAKCQSLWTALSINLEWCTLISSTLTTPDVIIIDHHDLFFSLFLLVLHPNTGLGSVSFYPFSLILFKLTYFVCFIFK